MVVGVDRALAAAIAGQDLVGAAGDHLVRVLLDCGAEPVCQITSGTGRRASARDLARRLLDRFGEFGVEAPDSGVHPSRRCFTKPSAWTISTASSRAAEREILIERWSGRPNSVAGRRWGRSCRSRAGVAVEIMAAL